MRRGFTLLELIVVLAILAIMATVATPALRSASNRNAVTPLQAKISAIRDSALVTGHAVTATVEDSGRVGTVTAYPDGSVLSSVGHVDYTTGRVRAVR